MTQPRPHDEALRADLVAAATVRLADRGPDALSLREVSAACGTSTTAIYALFGGKMQLIDAVIDEGWERLTTALTSIDFDPHPQRRLRDLGVAYRCWSRDNRELYAAMFTRDSGDGGAPLPAVSAGIRKATVPFHQASYAAILGTELTPDSPSSIDDAEQQELICNVVTAMWVSLHGWMSFTGLGLVDPSDVSFEEFIPQLVDAAVKSGQELYNPESGQQRYPWVAAGARSSYTPD